MLNSGAAQGEMPVEFVVAQFKWIMLVGGLITLTMLQAAFAPRAALRGLLGEEPQGQLGLLLALMVSAILMVRQSYEGRSLFAELERAKSEGRKLDADLHRLRAALDA